MVKLFVAVLFLLLSITAHAGAVLSNGTASIGINDQGNLIFQGVGLRYVPTGGEALAPGCDCEGWGVADIHRNVFAKAGRAFGVQNVVVESFESDAESATSVVIAADVMRVTHEYRPSNSENLFRNLVTIENISTETIDLRYRRAMDWDVPPTTFREMVTIVTNGASKVFASSDNGFMDGNPLTPITSIRFFGEAVDDGPADHGAVFDFAFGELAPGEKTEFVIYYGAANNESEALDALSIVGAEVYSLGKPNPASPLVSEDGTPNTFIFGFGAVGGTPLLRPLPDFTLGGLKVIDNGENQPVDLEVRVANAGMKNSAVPDIVTVNFFDGDPASGGTLLSSRDIASLGIGRYQDVRLKGVTGITNSEVFAVVDSDGQIIECRENNNSHSIPFLSTVPRGNLTVASDAAVYTTNQVTTLSGAISNTGLFDYSLNAQLIVETSTGELVEAFPAESLGLVTSGQNASVQVLWNTTGFVAGVYRVRGVLTDNNGVLVSESMASFRLDHDFATSPAASIRVSSDKQEYHVTDNIQLDGVYQNLTSNLYIENAHVELTVTDANGDFILQESVVVASLAPSQLVELSRQLELSKAPVGEYTIYSAVVASSGEVYAEDAATFTVLNDTIQSLSATLIANQETLFVGQTQTCQFTIENTGTAELSGIPISKRLINVDKQTGSGLLESTLSLSPNEVSDSIEGFSTRGLEAGNYACVLQATVDDQQVDLGVDQFVLEVPPINIVADLQVSTSPRLLVLVDTQENVCSDSTSGASQSQSDANDCVESEIPSLDTQLAAIDMVLANRVYKVVDNVADFEAELLSGQYQQYLLFNAYQPLDDFTVDLLREVVNRGEGLVFANGRTPQPLSLQNVLGISLPPTYKDCRQAVFAGRPITELNIWDVGTVEQNQVINGTSGDDFIKVSGAVQNAGSISGAGGNDIIQLVGWDNARHTSVTGDGGYNILVLNSDIVSVHQERGTNAGLVEFTTGGLANYNNFQEVIFIKGDGCPVFEQRLQADGVSLLDTPVTTAQDILFGLERLLPFVERDQAQLVGTFLNPDGEKANPDPLTELVPAITSNVYGKGSAIFIGYDILAEITQRGFENADNQHATLLRNSLEYTSSTTVPLRLNGIVPVQLTLENQGIEAPVIATLLWPLGSQLLNTLPTATTENELATWTFDLASNQNLALTSWAIPEYFGLTPTINNALVVANIFIGDNTQVPYKRLELTLQASEVQSLEAIKQDVLALIDMQTKSQYRHQFKDALDGLEGAEDSYNKGKLRKALTKLVSVTDYLKAIDTPDAIALRLRVDELLWQWGRQQ